MVFNTSSLLKAGMASSNSAPGGLLRRLLLFQQGYSDGVHRVTLKYIFFRLLF